MTIGRRRALKTLGIGGALAPATHAQDPAAPCLPARDLPAERLRTIQPALERRRTQLRALRDFEIDDSVSPFA